MKKTCAFFGLAFIILFSALSLQAQDKFYTIPSSAFRTASDTLQYANYASYSYLNSIGGQAYDVIAPVFLPQDATIISVTLSYYDGHASGNIAFSLVRINLYTRNSQILFSGSTSGTPGYGTLLDSTLDDGSRVIKNNSFYYVVGLEVTATTNLLWYCVKIKYQ